MSGDGYADACAETCHYGTCNAPKTIGGCGGCCGCLGGCQVLYEESLPPVAGPQ